VNASLRTTKGVEPPAYGTDNDRSGLLQRAVANSGCGMIKGRYPLIKPIPTVQTNRATSGYWGRAGSGSRHSVPQAAQTAGLHLVTPAVGSSAQIPYLRDAREGRAWLYGAGFRQLPFRAE